MPSHRLSSKRSIVWRGDLVRSRLYQSAYSEEREDVLPLVISLGFTAELSLEDFESDRTRLERIAGDLSAFDGNLRSTDQPAIPQEKEPTLQYWVPTRFQSPPWNARNNEPDEERETDANNDPHATPVMPVLHRPLATQSQLRTRLQPLLARPFVTRKVDEKKLVQRLCRCESISELPRLVRKRSPEQVHVIADRSDRCIPFFADQELVSQQIGRELAVNQCRFSVGNFPFLLSPANANLKTHWQGPSGLEDDFASEEPSPHTTVLILGDLAVLERHHREERASWVRCLRRWKQRGATIYALVPYALDQLPRELTDLVVPISWQGSAVDYSMGAQREALIRRIFVRSYPAMRLEPGLLRALRRMVPDAVDASLESDVWQHEWLASNHVDAARNDRADVKELLQWEFEGLDDAARRLVLSTQRWFRMSTGFRSLWQLEFLNQTPRTRRLLAEYEQDRAAMRRTLEEYASYVGRQAIHPDKQDQIVWYAKRASEAALRDEDVGDSVRKLREAFREQDTVHPATRIGDIPGDGIARSVPLAGHAEGIAAKRNQNAVKEPNQVARRVVLDSTSNLLELHVPKGALQHDRERVFWKSGIKPEWVNSYGTDQYGAWCEFQVPRHEGEGMVTQRLRWIPPGEFMMGSPESEEGRDEDEGPQHLVRLTQGYWLADSPVTQELWMAIDRRKNPSHFKGPRLPAECVSWDDCQGWLRKLSEVYGSHSARLPTEAEWEYACRAGSTTAYCFGDDPRELLNCFWYWENSKGQTHEVKQLLPNGWGLYDMHGNVSEWCHDRYRRYELAVETDPTGPASGADRVYRGGYYWANLVNCRTAARFNLSPDGWGSDIGFRFALESVPGAEPSEGAITPTEEPRVERVRVGSAAATPRPVRLDRFWKTGIVPDWVSDYGRDTYGLWCKFQVPRYKGKGMVTQCMRWIPPGKFMMGSPEREEEGFRDERPQQLVTLTQGYWLADSPVTQELWMAIDRKKNRSEFKGPMLPVESVTWGDCQGWLRKLNEAYGSLSARLPTEAEWEYACRAGSRTAYCFGDDSGELPKYAWYSENSELTTHSVKQLSPNAWGLHDMHGSVWEWCSDWFGEYLSTKASDPTGPEQGTRRVSRGGSYWSHPVYCRSACRGDFSPDSRSFYLGFRLAIGSFGGTEPNEGAITPAAEPGVERERAGSAQREYVFARSLDLDDRSPRALEAGFAELDFESLDSVRVISDTAGYQFDRLSRPAWAVDFGCDEYGLYARFEVQPISPPSSKASRSRKRSKQRAEPPTAVRQRLRWIPPGRFQMGSPENEAGRAENETQHWVNLTHGYWMFDTPCTQALWECVMGSNPSHFKDPERPVETVSWEVVSEFVSRLAERLPETLRFRLPTEAEWEYACRAGTTTATYRGDLKIEGDANAPLLDGIAWYGGNCGQEYDLVTFDEVSWLEDRQYPGRLGGTRKVAKKAPNAWGLYDMLGNVWEWCYDLRGGYGTEDQTDVFGPTSGWERVIRGGSWHETASLVRSANRFSVRPELQHNDLGFRLVSSVFDPKIR